MINLLSSDRQISAEEYRQWAHAYNAEQGLLAIGMLSWMLEWKDPRLRKTIFAHRPHNFGLWQLAYFAKTLIVESNDYRRKLVDESTLKWACMYYNNIREARLPQPTDEEGRRGVFNLLIRLSYEEFPFQIRNYRADLPRTFILFEEMAGAASANGFDVSKAFRDVAGLSVREFMLVGFAYWCLAGKGPIPSPVKTNVRRLDEILTPENQRKFLNLTAIDYPGFRAIQEKQESRVGFERHQFNCLHSYPLIWTQKSKALICPIPMLLIKRFTRGVFYYLLDAYSEGAGANRFSEFFGKHLFEPYVGAQLRTGFAERVFPEQDIGETDKSCDWIVVEGDALTLIECKTLGLTMRAKSFADTDVLLQDLRKRIVKSVQALARTKAAIEKGAKGFERWRGKSVRCLIVLYDEVYLFNAPLYRELIADDLKACSLDALPFQVCTISELEYVMPILAQRGLAATLDEKTADRERAAWDLAVFVSRLVDEGKLAEPPMNTLLAETYDEVFKGFVLKD